jgi:hypothetical protein
MQVIVAYLPARKKCLTHAQARLIVIMCKDSVDCHNVQYEGVSVSLPRHRRMRHLLVTHILEIYMQLCMEHPSLIIISIYILQHICADYPAVPEAVCCCHSALLVR